MRQKRSNFSGWCRYNWWGTRFRKKSISSLYGEGYNSEDVVLISERLIYEDILTSFYIRKYEIKTYMTNQGAIEKSKMEKNNTWLRSIS